MLADQGPPPLFGQMNLETVLIGDMSAGFGEEKREAPNIAPLGCTMTELQCNW